MLERFDTNQAFAVKNHLPIPYGGIKMFLGTMSTLGLLIAAWMIGARIHLLIDHTPHLILDAYINTISTTWLILGILYYSLSGARRKWISSYMKRNVRGYLLHLRKYKIPESTDTVWISSNQERESVVFTSSGAYTEIPLGGWFKRFRSIDPENPGKFQNCTMRILESNVSIGVIFVSLRCQTTRRHFDQLQMIDLTTAMRILNVMRLESFWIDNLSQAVTYLLQQDRALRAQIDSHKVASIQAA